jgi:rRNA maturation RNase YbeY
MSERIFFFTEITPFKIKGKSWMRRWIRETIKEEGYRTGEINIILCTDDRLRSINRKYLLRNFFTDIITFNLSEKEKRISGDLYISVDRIKENSKAFKVDEIDELHRVVIHGVLHLLGYNDHTKKGKGIIREKENYFLEKRIYRKAKR